MTCEVFFSSVETTYILEMRFARLFYHLRGYNYIIIISFIELLYHLQGLQMIHYIDTLHYVLPLINNIAWTLFAH